MYLNPYSNNIIIAVSGALNRPLVEVTLGEESVSNSDIEDREALHQSLLVKETIVGVSSFHKKRLHQYSMHPAPTTFLWMPIKRWLYMLGERGYHPEKIKKEIERLNKRYQEKLPKCRNEKEQKKLTKKNNKLIEAKKNTLNNGTRLMRIGEKSSYYDPSALAYNKKIFLNYLKSCGYLDAAITSKTVCKNNKVHITYSIYNTNLYKISSNKLAVSDQAIQALLLSHEKESHIKIGKVYQYQDFVNERNRLITLLSNNGYFDFNEQAIHFTAEVSQKDCTIAISTVIDQMKPGVDYIKTRVSKVIVNLTDYGVAEQIPPDAYQKIYQNILFICPKKTYFLKQLARKIAIKPGDFYNKSKIIESYEYLHSTSIFESITILPKIEEEELVIYIYAKPYERISIQVALGGECTDLTFQEIRPTIKFTPTIRQLFGKLNVAHFEASITSRPQALNFPNFYQNKVYRVECKFTTPHFMLLLPQKTNQKLEQFSPHTTIGIGYSFITNSVSGSQQKIDTTIHYNWQSQNKKRLYEFVPCTIASIHPLKKSHALAMNNEIESNIPSFLTTINGSTTIKNYTNKFSETLYHKWLTSIDIEVGGFYEHFFRMHKLFTKHKLQLYRYYKLDLVYQHTWYLSPYTLLVYQNKLGSIIRARMNEPIHPDKQYTIGGYNTIRAWNTATIGPGLYKSYEDPKVERPSKGELFLLGNIELRQKLIGHFEIAAFIDAGNIWNVSKNEPSITRFYWHNLYHALAIGGGVGIRFNFHNIFVLCFDIARKLHEPSGTPISSVEGTRFYFSLGYPF